MFYSSIFQNFLVHMLALYKSAAFAKNYNDLLHVKKKESTILSISAELLTIQKKIR